MNQQTDANTNRLTILLIDDEPGVLLALKLLMQTVGYAIKEFSDPLAAVEFLKGPDKCDVIICDLKMPKLDGIGVLQEAKKIRPDLPFILMSGHAQVPEIDRANALGSSGFLGKPFSPAQLKAKVDEAIISDWDTNARAEEQ